MNLYEQIEAYISGTLSSTERADFEQLLANDPEVKKAYDNWQETAAIVEKHETAAKQVPELRSLLEPLTREHFSGKPAAMVRQGRVRKLVLAAVAAAAVLFLFLFNPAGIDRYPVTPMPNVVVRGAASQDKEGGRLFNEAQYDKALPYLKRDATANPDDVMAAFYYGVCLLKTGKPADALPVFERLLQNNSAFQEDSYFFAALCAYKTSKKELAKQYATAVPPSNFYYKNAQRLLKKLE